MTTAGSFFSEFCTDPYILAPEVYGLAFVTAPLLATCSAGVGSTVVLPPKSSMTSYSKLLRFDFQIITTESLAPVEK